MLQIGLIGYGQMGKLLEQIASDYDCLIHTVFDPQLNILPDEVEFRKCDVFIDFTQPNAVLSNVKRFSVFGKPYVIGTTGWQNDIDKIKQITEQSDIGIIYGSNFSLGMNLFYHIIQNSTNMMQKCSEYDVYGYEIHHRLKKDSPSGTAKKICDIIQSEMSNKPHVQFDRVDRKIETNELHFASIRGGSVPGTHSVQFDSFADTIELKHTARNRNGFAIGALKAAKWIVERKGFYQFESIFLELL